ncbi:MAG: hypothetical protein ACREBB_09895 [Nitrosotalea sp.]
MDSKLYQKLQETKDEWEEARRNAREARDRKALTELKHARKNLYHAMKNLEEVRKKTDGTIPTELRQKEVEAYQRLLKLEKAYDLERRK